MAADDTVQALTAVLAEHPVECTGIGEVACGGCRERSWMSWETYREHLARAVLDSRLVVPALPADKRGTSWRCSGCGSPRWIDWRAGPADDGFPRRAQCAVCGRVQELPPGDGDDE